MIYIFCGKLLNCPASDATPHRSSAETRRTTGLSSLSTVKPRGCMAALQRSDFFARRATANFVTRKPTEGCARNERPVRGDNRTGQAIWALGVDGRSRLIQPRWGGITAPTYIGRGRAASRSNRPPIFFGFLPGYFGAEIIAPRGERPRCRPILSEARRPWADSGLCSREPAVHPTRLPPPRIRGCGNRHGRVDGRAGGLKAQPPRDRQFSRFAACSSGPQFRPCSSAYCRIAGGTCHP